AAHAPADDADAAGVDILALGEISERRLESGDRAVLRQSAHELVRFVRCRGDFSAIEIGRESYVAFFRVALCLILDPVVQPPPFLNDDEAGMFSFRLWLDEISAAFPGKRVERDGGSFCEDSGGEKRER